MTLNQDPRPCFLLTRLSAALSLQFTGVLAGLVCVSASASPTVTTSPLSDITSYYLPKKTPPYTSTSPSKGLPADIQEDSQYLQQSAHSLDKVAGANSNTKHNKVKSAPHFDRRYCEGVWVYPSGASAVMKDGNHNLFSKDDNTHSSRNKGINTDNSVAPIHALADHAYIKPNVVGRLSGDVVITQADKTIHTDTLELNLTTSEVTTKGKTKLQNGDFYTITEGLSYNTDDKTSAVNEAAFFSQAQQAHGTAKHIKQNTTGEVTLLDVSYTTCAPTKKSWEVLASKLTLNEDAGRAVARDARLRLLGFPALYLPYLNFPISDERMSGFLTPRLGFSNDGGLDFSLPYYLNLAPNFDATLTPRFLLERGAMLEGELRHLTHGFGESKLTAGYLPNDNRYGKDRSYAKLEHDWQANKRMKIEAEYSHVSDKNYFTDLGKNPLVQDELNLPRNVVATYTDNKRELLGQLRFETFQTVDKTLPDANKPYSRLPQLSLDYAKGDPLGMSQHANIDLGYFIKSIDDYSAAENSGFRLYGDYTLDYMLASSWGYIKPAVSVAAITTIFDDNAVNSQGLVRGDDDTASAIIPTASVDTGLVLEKHSTADIAGKTITTTQTLEPRVFIMHAPSHGQTDLPNFDTVAASPSFDQLFTAKRFLGHDRIADGSLTSIGLDYRVYDEGGLERFNLGVATQYHFNDNHINLSGKRVDVDPVEGYFGRVKGYLLPNLSLNANVSVDNRGKRNFTTAQLGWRPKAQTLINVGYFDRTSVLSSNQQTYRTATTSLIAPLDRQWQLLGHSQYDLTSARFRDILVGANYESCCYGFAIYGRSHYNNLDDPEVDSPRRQIMAELTLKGLAGISGGLDSLLEQRVLGYRRFIKK